MKLTNIQKIGFFVIAILIVLFFVINFLRGTNLFSGSNNYYTYLSNVEGVTKTSPVYIRGLKVGTIEDIRFNPVRDSFLVKMSIKKEYVLPIDSKTELYSSDILGGKALRIQVGNSSYTAKGNDTLKGVIVEDMLSLLASNMGTVKEKLDNVLEDLDITLKGVNNVLDSTSQESLKGSIRKLNASLANVESLSNELKSSAPDLKKSMSNLSSMTTSLSDPNGALNSTLNNLNTLSNELASVELKKSIDQLNELIQKIQSPSSSTGKLITTDKLHNELEGLIEQLNSLVKKIEENPKKYLRLSVF